jgi:hypothetical protein
MVAKLRYGLHAPIFPAAAMDGFSDETSSGSAAALAQHGGGPTGASRGVSPQGLRREAAGDVLLGPCLHEHMGEQALVAALNAWGSARDREALALRADLAATQSVVSAAFDQAQAGVSATLLAIIEAFRTEAATMRQHASHEAQQSLARLELVVAQARVRFDEQDARFSAGLGELAQGLQSADEWAQLEPARIAAAAAAFQTLAPQPAPVAGSVPKAGAVLLPPWMSAVPKTPPARPAQPDADSPGRLAMGPALQTSPAWAAYAAGRAAQGPAPPDAWAGAPRHFDLASPPGFGGGGGGKGGGAPRDLRINTRDWGDQRKLDIATTFDGFQVWKDRAVTHLSKERPDVRALLMWAETQSKDQLETGLVAHAERLGVVDLAAVEYAVHDGIKAIVLDSLLGRARNCIGRGCEFWRALSAEWHGAAPQLRDAKARRFLEPPRCKDTNELWSKLPAWERLGEEVELSDLKLPEWMRNVALEKLLPTQLLSTLVSRSELFGYSVRLAWVKTQMEHARGIAQAAAYGPGAGKDASGDVYMNSVEAAAAADPPDGLAWAMANAVEQGDWAQAEALQVAIFALKGGGKGKGKGKGKPGAAAPAAAPKGGHKFEGVCNHCHIWGHRRSECRRLDAELAKAGGGGKAKGKGKGGPKGGKGPPADQILECATAGASEDDWAAALAAGDGDYADEWSFENSIASLAPWEQTPAGRGRRGARRPLVAPTAVQNQFAGLNSLLDDSGVLLGAVAGETRGGRVVEAVVDSGAMHSVTPPGLFPGEVCPSPWSRTGRCYRAANGTSIRNLGQVDVPFATLEGHKCKIPFQVAEVEQPLLSVAHLTSAGNLVQLGHTDGTVVNLTTGRSIALERRGGVYVMKMFIADAAAPLPFRRQGA